MNLERGPFRPKGRGHGGEGGEREGRAVVVVGGREGKARQHLK